MIYDDLLQKQLYTNSTVMDLLSKDVDYPTAPALYNDLVTPENLPREASSINFYGISYNTEGYGEEIFYANCRESGYATSLILAQTVREELHRHNNADNDSIFICNILRTLPPADKTDNYNTTVEIKVTTRAIR